MLCSSVQPWATEPEKNRCGSGLRSSRGLGESPLEDEPRRYEAEASEALLEESAWRRMAPIPTVSCVLLSVACHLRLWSRPSI